MLRIPNTSEITTLKELWLSSFSDEIQYIDFFFENRFSQNHTAVLVEKDRIEGMIHFMPCSIGLSGKAVYWYAVCIRKDLRGKGLFREFATDILEILKEKNISSFCVPAPSAQNLYQKFGFTNEIWINTKEFSGSEKNSNLKIELNQWDQYLTVMKDHSDVKWPDYHLNYAIRENNFCGGSIVTAIHRGKEFASFANIMNDTLIFENGNFDSDFLTETQNEWLRQFNCKKISLKQFGKSDDGNKNHLFALSNSPDLCINSKIPFTLS